MDFDCMYCFHRRDICPQSFVVFVVFYMDIYLKLLYLYSFVFLVSFPLIAEGLPSARYSIDTLIKFIHSFIHSLWSKNF